MYVKRFCQPNLHFVKLSQEQMNKYSVCKELQSKNRMQLYKTDMGTFIVENIFFNL